MMDKACLVFFCKCVKCFYKTFYATPKGDKTKRIKVEREKSGKALIYKGFEDNEQNEREKRNVTFALHLLYVWVRFERCLKGIALHRG